MYEHVCDYGLRVATALSTVCKNGEAEADDHGRGQTRSVEADGHQSNPITGVGTAAVVDD